MKAKNTSKIKKKKNRTIYAINIFLVSFFISMLMSVMSQGFLSAAGTLISFLILIIVVSIGVGFDIIGLAVTTCEVAPFHSMASKKNKYAVYAIRLINNAPLVATIAQDVVGDISGIISGALIVSIAYNLVIGKVFSSLLFLNVLLSSIVAGVTVGTKAICKQIAIDNSKKITFFVARRIYQINYIFTLKWMKGNKNEV